MKAQILKIAGVKNEKDFYKKFPTEEAFMAKHGAEFKAKCGTSIKKAQFGTEEEEPLSPFSESPYINAFPKAQQLYGRNFGNNVGFTPSFDTSFPQTDTNPLAMQNVGKQWADNNQLPLELQENVGFTPKYPMKQPNAGMKALEQLPMVGKILGGLSALEAEKQQRRAATQMEKVSDIMLKASGTRPERVDRRWVRPEDNVVDGNALFPVDGVGTNVLTGKHGVKVPKKKAKFGSFMSTENTNGFLQNFGEIAPSIADYATGNNAGGTMGGAIGGALGSFTGNPLLAKGLETVGTLAGGLLDKNPKRTKRAQEATMRNMNNMALNQAAPSVQAGYASHLQNGGNIDGELQIYGEGNAETMSYNPHLPGSGETVMFRGPSHAEEGIDINYSGKRVNVEGGEPAVKLPSGQGEESLTVFGDIIIPIGEGKGKKFKNYVADLSKKEATSSKILEKNTLALNNFEPKTPQDKLKFNSYKANILGSNMRLKEIADKKMEAAELQRAINETAEELGGVEPNAMLKGKMKPNKLNNKSYALYGTTTDESTKIPETDVVSTDALGYVPSGQRAGEMFYGKVTNEGYDQLRQNNPWYDWDSFNPKDPRSVQDFQTRFNALATRVGSPSRLVVDGKLGEQTATAKIGVGTPVPTPAMEEAKLTPMPPTSSAVLEEEKRYGVTPYKKNPWVDAFNMTLPFLRPTDQEPLDGQQLLGEMYAMSNNQVEPVQAQTYQPELDLPYDISLQDQLNANQADYRSAQRMVGYNPAAQASINAQKYAANSNVLGEQFRANQALKDRVYSGNRATLNDAKLKNLAIYDQQYTRQSQALSNTKATSQAVLNSISDKYMKNKLENRTLGIYENMYNYRYDAAGRAINMNPLFQPNIPQKYQEPDPNYIPVEDAKGNIIKYKYIGEPQQPSLSTNGIAPPKSKKGMDIKKCFNGALVQAYK